MTVFDCDLFDGIPGADIGAVVTPLGGVAVTTTVQWFQDPGSPSEQVVGAGPVSATNRRQVAYVRRDELPDLPVGSTITGGPAHRQRTWTVLAVDDADEEYHHATVY